MIHKFSAERGKLHYRERGYKVCIKSKFPGNSNVFYKQDSGVGHLGTNYLKQIIFRKITGTHFTFFLEVLGKCMCDSPLASGANL